MSTTYVFTLPGQDARNEHSVTASELSPDPGEVGGCSQPCRPWVMGEGATLIHGAPPVRPAVLRAKGTCRLGAAGRPRR